uniref:Uncharacterized protein n=1 Tax=Rhizophora mucronata TaxID=61149 RepID=A0A2P2KCM1_RHIMU
MKAFYMFMSHLVIIYSFTPVILVTCPKNLVKELQSVLCFYQDGWACP